jgi:hypothetical protein
MNDDTQYWYAECHFAECHLSQVSYMLSVANKPISSYEYHYAECHYSDCHCSECRGAVVPYSSGASLRDSAQSVAPNLARKY